MNQLTHKEEEVMQILWELKNAFVKDIIAVMDDPKPPYNTISSIVRKLEGMGVIGHESYGKTHRYFPILKKEKYRKFSMQKMLGRYFGGSPAQLLSYFVKEEELSEEEIKELLDNLKN